jgi:hypothetical protein
MKYALTILLLLATATHAKTWLVGPMRQYTVPSAVMNLVADGDTVLIDSGLYTGDVGVWNNNNLVIRCPDGMARFNANGNIAQDKGIWVLAGNNTYVEGFEFYGAAIDSADGDNGAGIRVGGNGLTCRRCYFHDNQEGILTGNDTTNNNIWIEACEFDHNGVENGGAAGFEHNIYIGLCSTCTIKFCSFTRSIVGHELKCRANESYILYNYIADGPTGDGSLSIDIPQGGLAFVIGNSIEKGPMTANSTVIGYGEEGFKNPDTDFYFINNTIVTDRNPTTFFEIAAGTKTALIANNIIAGTGHPIAGFTDTEANVIQTDTSFFHFANPTNYNYNITENFPGFQNAATLGSVDGFSLTPVSEYVNLEDSTPRQFLNEVGAFTLNMPSASDSIFYIKNFDSIICSPNLDTAIIGIKNTGNDTAFYQPGITGTSQAAYTILLSSLPSTPPGGVDTFFVVFNSGDAVGTSSAILTLIGGIGSFPLNAFGGIAVIEGEGTAPQISVGSTEDFTAKVCNTGTCDFVPGAAIVNPPFAYVSGADTSIAPGDCVDIIFSFSPTEKGTFTTMANFTNGLASPYLRVDLAGTATSSGVTQTGTTNASQTEQNYPNPFDQTTQIALPSEFAGVQGAALSLYDVTGALVLRNEYPIAASSIEFSRENLSSGVYYYRIVSQDGKLECRGSVVIAP